MRSELALLRRTIASPPRHLATLLLPRWLRGTGGATVFRVLGYAEHDPWLRVGPTLSGQGDGVMRDALLACAPVGVGSYRLAWTISLNGIAQDVAVTPITAPGDGSGERVAACVRDAESRAGFPCPRGGAAVPVTARLCLGHL